VPGVYVAGDADDDMHVIVVAASEGACAAFAITTDLLRADLR
jgi:thioredoxin reductase